MTTKTKTRPARLSPAHCIRGCPRLAIRGGRGLCRRCYLDPKIRAGTPFRTSAQVVYPPCRHCERRPGCRPRCLCSRCYQSPTIRGLYSPICGESVVSQQEVETGKAAERAGERATILPIPIHGGSWRRPRTPEEAAPDFDPSDLPLPELVEYIRVRAKAHAGTWFLEGD